MIQSLRIARGFGATTHVTPRVNIHDCRMSVPILGVNVQRMTKTTAISNRWYAIRQPEQSCATTRFTLYHLSLLSRRECPHLVVHLPFHVIRYAISTFHWLESYDINRLLRHETAPRSYGCHEVPQRRSPSRGKGSSVLCHGDNGVLSRYCVDWMRYMA